MKIAIAHHHLGAGGVTRVIANHLLALDAALSNGNESLEVALLADEQNDGWPVGLEQRLSRIVVHRRIVPSLAYRPGLTGNAEQLANDVRRALKNIGFQEQTDVLHVHNHALGKHSVWGQALLHLSRDSGLLLQCHDFAEDFRPANYEVLKRSYGGALPDANYFQAPHIHYATLNARDEAILKTAGVVNSRLHVLPNPVPAAPELADRAAARRKLEQVFGIAADQPYWLYPVRGIRRKNVGELCLLAAAGRGRVTPAITLNPTNPKEQRFYNRWQQFSSMAKHKLPVIFNAGEMAGLTFEENLAAADRIVTTSVAEGFGMVFLEAWLAGKLLVGRDLPEITVDFKEAGLNLSHLRPRLDIPLGWIDADRYVSKLLEAYNKVAAAFARPTISESAARDSLSARSPQGTIDFADLDEELQERVIERVWTDSEAADVVYSQWQTLPDDTSHSQLIKSNRDVAESSFSLLETGRKLLGIYKKIAQSDRGQYDSPADGEKVLDEFLSLERFRLIRT